MNTDRELMQQALEALEFEASGWEDPPPITREAITALRERLAQPEQCQCPECQITPHASDCAVHNEPAYPKGACNCGAQPEQEPVDSAEMASAYMDARLWEFIDMAAAWPEARPDPRTWDHVLVYAPKQRKSLTPQSPCEMTQAERKMFRLGWLECEAAHGIKGS